MTEQRMPGFDQAFARGMTSRRMSRRNMMKLGGATVGTLSLAQILAACGGGTSSGPGGDTSAPGATMPDYGAEPGPTINFANWPLYIDQAKDENGTKYNPTLDQFKEETGITVNYNDEINDNAEFVSEILPQLQAGQNIERDIIVVTNGQWLTALQKNGYVYELDAARRPNFDANAADWARDPFFDPGNKYGMCWQSGLTGIGYNTDLVLAPITKAADLMDSTKCPPNSVGVLKGDAPDFAMITLGIDPKVSTPDQWAEAAAWLTTLRDSETFRTAYTQDYVDDLNAGNLSATMGWSGDILYYAIWEGYNYEFVLPEDGALLWIDSMLIPVNATNPAGAYALMDYYYRPEVAQTVTEWVLYMSPVPAVQALIAQHGEDQDDDLLRATAENPLLWPDEAILDQTSLGVNLQTDEEIAEFSSIFDPIWEG